MMELAVDSLQAPIHLRMPSADIKVYEKVFLEQEYRFEILSPPRIIVDAGAHIGLASVYFANRYPAARIIAIEPEKDNFELLKKNVAPYRTITPVHAGLWSDNHDISLFDPSGGSWGFATSENTDSASIGRFCHTVSGITVERLMEDFKIDRIDILKMDIEGTEKELFNDSSSWLANVDALIIELHERLRPGCSRNFYNQTNGFGAEWMQGENVFLARPGSLMKSQLNAFAAPALRTPALQ